MMASTSRSAASMVTSLLEGSLRTGTRRLTAPLRVAATPAPALAPTSGPAASTMPGRGLAAPALLLRRPQSLLQASSPSLVRPGLWNHGYATQAYTDAKPVSHAKPSSSASASVSASPSQAAAEESQGSSSSKAEPGSEEEPPPNSGIRARLRFLMRRYGWWALAVYMLASVFDFSLAFASIHLLGADHIRELEEKVREKVGMGKREMEDEEAAVWPVPLGALLGEGGQEGEEQKRSNNAAEAKMALARIRPTSSSSNSSSGENEDVAAEAAAAAPTAAASKAKKKMGAGSGTLWTEAVLAYTIHKTLLMPLRLGITAAFTPRFVKWMVKMGWARNNQAVHQAAFKAKAARDARKAAASSA